MLPPMQSPPFALTAADVDLEAAELPPEQVVSGTPAVRSRKLSEHAGVWEISAGVVTDVEVDEVFVVLSGRATVEIEDGPVLELAPGTVGALKAGDKTVWRVHETLRKVYVA